MLKQILSKPIFRLSVVILVNENILRTTPVLCKEIKQRSFARWSTRKPSKVFTPEQVKSGNFDTDEFYKSQYDDKENVAKDSSRLECEEETEQKEELKHSDESIHSSKGPDYEYLDEHDSTFSNFMTLVGNRKMRRKNNLMMLEGKRLNLDALKTGLKPKKLFFTQKSFLDDLNIPPGSKIHLFKIPYRTVTLWSKLETPPGVIGFYGIPKERDIMTENMIPVKVLCDNVRDPGNMGSIIRVAAGVGCSEIILMKGCTDPWDAKVLRSASGGHFHIPIRMDVSWKELTEFVSPRDSIFISDSNADKIDMYNFNLPRHLYHDVKYTTPHSIVVVIGGETEGVSYEAFKMASELKGSRIYIPLSNCVESLNSGCALSVVLFEIKKQLFEADRTFSEQKTESFSQVQDDLHFQSEEVIEISKSSSG